MSLFDALIIEVLSKHHNDENFVMEEKIIYELYMKNIAKIIFESNNTIIDISKVNSNLQMQLLKNNNYIVKLIFSNNKNLYTSLSNITRIEYFKNMLCDYAYDENVIIPIVLGKELDNYDVMLEIIYYVNIGICRNIIYTFDHYYNNMVIVDYMGLVTYREINIIKKIADNYNVMEYDNITYEKYKRLHTIIYQNEITNNSKIILLQSWTHIMDLDDNINDFCNLTFFKDIIETNLGRRFILKYKLMQFYSQIVSMDTYEEIMDHIIKNQSVYTWNIISDYFANPTICTFIEKNIDHIEEVIFDVDITLLPVKIKLALVIKFNKVEYLNNVCKIIEKDKVA